MDWARLVSRIPVYRHIKNEMQKRSDIRSATQLLQRIEAAAYIERNLHGNPKYDDARRLARHEFSVFSQFGEDGAIREIFRRIGETNRFFIEMGVGDGLENNTAYLLAKGWRGAWVEGNSKHVAAIRTTFAEQLKSCSLMLSSEMITAANVERILASFSIPEQPDLLSLDIDYGTYWVWQAIVSVRPRVVVIEYNAIWPPQDAWIVGRDDAAQWDGTSHMGSSLGALCRLASEKGYCLVGCAFAGSNAFLVRQDLVGTLFCEPYTAENHYEPPRYFLYYTPGHRRGWGPFVTESGSHFNST
jgi:hypothetical protein